MKIEWRVWNIHKDWQLLNATTLAEAAKELQAKMPYSEEAQIRIDGNEVRKFVPNTRNQINFGPYD